MNNRLRILITVVAVAVFALALVGAYGYWLNSEADKDYKVDIGAPTVITYNQYDFNEAGKTLVPEGAVLNPSKSVYVLTSSFGISKADAASQANYLSFYSQVFDSEGNDVSYLFSVLFFHQGSSVYGAPLTTQHGLFDFEVRFKNNAADISNADRDFIKNKSLKVVITVIASYEG